MSVLDAEGLRVCLGGVSILEDSSLTLEAGEVTCVVGPSGSGKSTLLHVLSGLVKPAAGTVRATGRDIWPGTATHRRRFRAQNLGFLSQEFILLRHLDAQRNVALGLVVAGLSPRRARARARESLAAFGLDDATTASRNLSRGERQRVALARALALERPLVMLDEPTSSLDEANRERVLGAVRERAKDGAAVLITSHDEATTRVADRVLRLSAGALS